MAATAAQAPVQILPLRLSRLTPAVGTAAGALRSVLGTAGDTNDLDRTLTQQGLVDSPVFRSYANLGAAFLEQGKYAKAVEAFRAAVRTNPTDANTHFQLGVALQTLGRTNEAVAAYKEAVRLDPNHASARRALQAASAGRG